MFESATTEGARAGMVGRAGGLSLGLQADGIKVALPGRGQLPLQMTFVGGRRTVTPRGLDLQKSETNYLLGSDARRWRTHVPNYARVKYEGLYPGVDVIFYGNGQEIEHDFVVAPGADPGQIRMHFAGAKVVAAKDGSITVGRDGGRLVLRAPVVYQQVGDRRRERHGAFRVLANGDVSFRIRSYDRRRTLVIDPVLSFATYLADAEAKGTLIAVDGSGASYLAGSTTTAFPVTPGAFAGCSGCAPSQNVTFVSKLSADGTSLVYSTLLGGSQAVGTPADQPTGIALDAQGDALVCGFTNMSDFPTRNSRPVRQLGGAYAGYLVSLSPDGSALNFGTLLGTDPGYSQSIATYALAVAVDGAGAAYVTGITGRGFATTPGALNQGGNELSTFENVYLEKFAANGSLIYSAVLGDAAPQNGGTGSIGSTALQVDAAGGAYVAGQAGTLWPITSGAYRNQIAGAMPYAAPFVAKVSPDASSLTFSTFLDNAVSVAGIALLSNGDVLVAGSGAGLDYPTTAGAYQTNTGNYPAFISELKADGSGLVSSTVFGSTDPVFVGYNAYTLNGMAVDATNGDIWVAGTTSSPNFPLQLPLQPSVALAPDGIGPVNTATLSQFDATGHTLKLSTFLGGTAAGSARGVAIDANHRAHVSGDATYGMYTTPGVLDPDVPAPASGYESLTHSFAVVVDPAVPAPALCLSLNGGLNFQSVPVNSFRDGFLTVTSCGAEPLTLGVITTGGHNFAVPGDVDKCSSQTLAVGQSCTVRLRYTPAAPREDRTMATIPSNAPVPQAVIALNGSGVLAPVLEVTPDLLSFGAQIAGTISAPQTVTVRNTGSEDLDYVVVALSGANAGSFSEASSCPTMLPPGGSCTVSVTFAPKTTGDASAFLAVNGANQSTSISYELGADLRGTAPAAPFTVGPQSGGSSTQTVIAGKPAAYALSVTPAAGYTGTLALSCGSLPANAACSFSPGSVAISGGAAAPFTLTITTEATATARLRGAGIGIVFAGVLAALPWMRRKSRWSAGVLCLSCVVMAGAGGCGGKPSTPTPTPTPAPTQATVAPGTYTVQVTASDGTNKQTQALVLVVQ